MRAPLGRRFRGHQLLAEWLADAQMVDDELRGGARALGARRDEEGRCQREAREGGRDGVFKERRVAVQLKGLVGDVTMIMARPLAAVVDMGIARATMMALALPAVSKAADTSKVAGIWVGLAAAMALTADAARRRARPRCSP